jgi:hypothetical protein
VTMSSTDNWFHQNSRTPSVWQRRTREAIAGEGEYGKL